MFSIAFFVRLDTMTSMHHRLRLFMWGYQPHFRLSVELLARDVFKTLGSDVAPEVILVGARKPGSNNRNPVCIEPEDGRWDLSLFNGLLTDIEATASNHRLNNVVYGDEPSMRDKPENMRRDSVRTSIQQALAPFDRANAVVSFCGSARPVGDFYVVPVVQVSSALFDRYPPLNFSNVDEQRIEFLRDRRSLVHSAVYCILDEAKKSLEGPDPGRTVISEMRSADEVAQRAAHSFLTAIGMLVGDVTTGSGLWDHLNLVSSLLYEGAAGIGRLVLARRDSASVHYAVKFAEPVPFAQPRWARKILQMTSPALPLISDVDHVYGLGMLDENHDSSNLDAFEVTFTDHYSWELNCGNEPLIVASYRTPRLPAGPIDRNRFLSNYLRIFHDAGDQAAQHIWQLFNAALDLGHGSTLVMGQDAATESERLARQGTRVAPFVMTADLLSQVSAIDGSILLDPQGRCHSIGVILDGLASAECTPARGSRYNSALRYVQAAPHARLAIVVSDDRSVDIIPLLRPTIRQADLESAIACIKAATLDDYHDPRSWLDSHRLYLNASQCKEVNAALDRIETLPREVGEIVIITRRFTPDPACNGSYFDEGGEPASS